MEEYQWEIAQAQQTVAFLHLPSSTFQTLFRSWHPSNYPVLLFSSDLVNERLNKYITLIFFGLAWWDWALVAGWVCFLKRHQRRNWFSQLLRNKTMPQQRLAAGLSSLLLIATKWELHGTAGRACYLNFRTRPASSPQPIRGHGIKAGCSSVCCKGRVVDPSQTRWA